MKELFENLLKILPQPLLVALVVSAASYFVVFYHYGYTSHYEAFRNPVFRNLAIIAFFIALLVMVNAPKTGKRNGKPVLIFPMVRGDPDQRLATAFRTSLESTFDRTLGRTKSVLHLDSFVADEATAAENMAHYGAPAAIYGAEISNIGDEPTLCFYLRTSERGTLPRFPPARLRDPARDIQTIVSHVCGKLVEESATAAENPILAKLVTLERRIDNLDALMSRGQPSAQEADTVVFQNAYALIVGLNTAGRLPEFRLAAAERDASQIAKALADGFGCSTTLLLGVSATSDQIEQALKRIGEQITENDLFVFYFSGNAILVGPALARASADAVLMTYDYEPKATKVWSGKELVSKLAEMPCRHSIVFIDACHAALGLDRLGPEERKLAVPNGKSVQVLASCLTTQVSYEVPDGGIFSKALLSLLRGGRSTDGISPHRLAQQIQESPGAREQHTQTTTLLQLGALQSPVTFQRASR